MNNVKRAWSRVGQRIDDGLLYGARVRGSIQGGLFAVAAVIGVLVLGGSAGAGSLPSVLAAGRQPAALVAVARPLDRDHPSQASISVAVTAPTVPVLEAAPAGPAVLAVSASALAADGIPATALDAYRRAAAREARLDPACGISWTLIAAIGRIESDHGRFGGAVLRVDGTSMPKIIGIALDGSRSELIADTDHGVLDGDPVFDHAVGPMQFIPSTWARDGVDGNGDHLIDPFNIYDAAATAAHYLCVAGGEVKDLAGMTRAVFAYNHLDRYVTEVLALQAGYAGTPVRVTAPVPLPPTIARTAPSAVVGSCSPTPTQSVPATPATTASGSASPTLSPSPSPSPSPTTSPSPTASPSASGTQPDSSPTSSSPARGC